MYVADILDDVDVQSQADSKKSEAALIGKLTSNIYLHMCPKDNNVVDGADCIFYE